MPENVAQRKKKDNLFRTIIRIILKKSWPYILNTNNRIRYGASAPRYGEVIWVNPRDVSKFVDRQNVVETFGFDSLNMIGISNAILTSTVIEFGWSNLKTTSINNVPKIKACFEHWINGVVWENTGIYEVIEELVKKEGVYDQCENVEDIVKRYENLDSIFEQTKKEGKFKMSEDGSIEMGYTHIGPGGEPIFGGGAHHRFAIAYILNIPFPTRLGLVHVSAIPYLDNYRKERENKSYKVKEMRF